MTLNELATAAKSKVKDAAGYGSATHPNGRLCCCAWGVGTRRGWTARADFMLDGKKISRASAVAFLANEQEA